MLDLLGNQPQGIGLTNLFEALEEKGYVESDTRSAFLGLVGTHQIDIDQSRKDSYNVIAITS